MRPFRPQTTEGGVVSARAAVGARAIVVGVSLVLTACSSLPTNATPATMPAPSATVESTASLEPTASATASASAVPSPIATASPAPSATATAVGSAVLLTNGPRTRKVVALTFDDGWAPQRCLAIGQTLMAQHATATFFINGKYLREAPSVYRWLADQGFMFGNHSFSHHDQATLTEDGVRADLDASRRTLEAVTGAPSLRVFRPPFGSSDATVLAGAAAAGYQVALTWDVDSRDWAGVSVDQVVANATRGTNGSVVLMHCGPAATPVALARIIAAYRSRGFTFVSVADMLGLGAPDGPLWTPSPTATDWPSVRLPVGGTQWHPSLAVDAAGDLHVAYETPDGIEVATDAGGSWTSELVVRSTPAAIATAPVLAIDPSGAGHLAYVRITPVAPSLVVATNASGAWVSQVLATMSANPSTVGIGVDRQGHTDIVWRYDPAGSPGTRLTSDASGSWRTTRVGVTALEHDPSVAVDASGHLEVLWLADDGVTRLATNGSGSWAISDLRRGFWSGDVRIDPSGRTVLALADMRDPTLALMAADPSGGWSWIPVIADADGPSLAFLPDGRAIVAYWRLDPTSGSSEVFLATQPTDPRLL